MVKPKEVKVEDIKGDEDRLVAALIKAKEVSKESIEGKLPELRKESGIPAAARDGGRGGWFLRNPWDRVVDFKRSDNADPVLYLALRGVSVPKTARAVAKQIRNLRKTSYGVDEAMTLVMAWREGGDSAVGSSDTKRDSYDAGGLDHFHREMSGILRKYLPGDFPKTLPKGRLWGQQSTERSAKVYPAMIPINRMVEAYGARLNWCKLGFKVSMKKLLKIDVDPDSLTIDAKRAWIAAYLGTPGSCIMFAHQIRRKGSGDYNLIVDPDFTGKYLIPGTAMKPKRDAAGNVTRVKEEVYNSVKTALIRAAESKYMAELIPGLKEP